MSTNKVFSLSSSSVKSLVILRREFGLSDGEIIEMSLRILIEQVRKVVEIQRDQKKFDLSLATYLLSSSD